MKIEIYDRGGEVVFGIPEKDYFLIFEPGQAVDIANTILHAAQNCGADIKFEVDKPILSDTKHMALIRRTELIMSSLRAVKDKKQVATQIVDSILAEIL